MKVLGVYFDSKLTWEKHIRHNISKCSSKLAVLRKLRRNFNSEQFKSIITSQYFSQLYYCSEVWLSQATKANLKNLIRTAHYKALRVLQFDFEKKKTRSELTKLSKRATPTEWSQYMQANLVIKCLNSQSGSRYLRDKLRETLFTTRRKPGIGKFFNNAKGKIGKQSIQNRLKFMDAIQTDWLGTELNDDARRRLLKKTFFSYET